MNENKYVKAFLAPRIGRGIYGIGLAIVCIVTAVPRAYSVQELAVFMRSGIAPGSLMPMYIGSILCALGFSYLIYKRLMDIGKLQSISKKIAGCYAGIYLLACVIQFYSYQKIINVGLSIANRSTSERVYEQMMMIIKDAKSDIDFCSYIIIILFVIAIAGIFIKGTDGENDNGEKPITLKELRGKW